MEAWERELTQRIEECRKAAAEAGTRRLAASDDEDRAIKAAQGYESALAYERYKRTGKRETGSSAPVPDVVLTDTSTPATNGNGHVSKAEFARQFIRGRADGTTPADLFKGFQGAGIGITKPYIYSLVQRLKEREAIRLKRGRWFFVPESERAG